MSEEPDVAMVRKAAEALGEHFDSVQIFCTRHDSNDVGTVRVGYGCGNWFARFGQINEWLIREQEYARKQARSDNE